jgi:hypothetical protein
MGLARADQTVWPNACFSGVLLIGPNYRNFGRNYQDYGSGTPYIANITNGFFAMNSEETNDVQSIPCLLRLVRRASCKPTKQRNVLRVCWARRAMFDGSGRRSVDGSQSLAPYPWLLNPRRNVGLRVPTEAPFGSRLGCCGSSWLGRIRPSVSGGFLLRNSHARKSWDLPIQANDGQSQVSVRVSLLAAAGDRPVQRSKA